jgi:biopolymer transport protein ExbB
MLAGGWVLIPIFLVGAVAFGILIFIALELGGDLYNRDFEKRVLAWISNPSSLKGSGVVINMLQASKFNEAKTTKGAFYRLQRSFLEYNTKLQKGMHMVSVLAATAPLLGLLGTVTGMVGTFDIITIYGNSNPVLMAGGISEALITTQSGLVIAFPLLLWKHRLEDKIAWIQKQMQNAIQAALNENIKGEG